MHQRIAEWLVAWNHNEPAEAVVLVYLAIGWVAIMGCGLVAWWKGFYAATEDPDWTHEGNWR